MLNGAHPPPKQIRFVHSQGQPPAKRRRVNAACLTCRRRKTRCFGERPVCSTCTKNSYTCQGYSDDADKNKQEEDTVGSSKAALTGFQPHGNDSDDENERRHSKSKLSAAQSTPAPIGWPSQERGTDERLRRPAPSALDRKDSKRETRRLQDGVFVNDPAFTQERRNSTTGSRRNRRSGACRVPYPRYFGPTAIAPGYKQVMVSVNDRRRSNPADSISEVSPPRTLKPSAVGFDDSTDEVLSPDKLPVYDPSDSESVPPLILSLVQTFFLHLGSSYPFLKQDKFINQVKEKRADSFLVDAVCALAARFSDPTVLRGDGAISRSEYGQFYLRRAKAATVDTFGCPSVGAVQAFLLMAYEGFNANQDSALWMYLGLAIWMAVDLGLQKVAGVKSHGDDEPLHTKRQFGRLVTGGGDLGTNASMAEATGSSANLFRSEKREIEQERFDTLWAVFALDRVVSFSTGRTVTFRFDDFELGLPEPTVDPTTGWPDPYPHFIRVIHLFARVSDALNNTRDGRCLPDEEWNELAAVEAELTKEHRSLDRRLDFNAANFRAYVTAGKPGAFVLLHFWLHALVIVLHQPTLLVPLGGYNRSHQLLPNSRELSMSSAKTIADILTFAELIAPKSLVGNPLFSQPIYLAACAFLTEAAASDTRPVSPTPSPQPALSKSQSKPKSGNLRSLNKHFLLSSAASQSYHRCYNALGQLYKYWGGVESLLTALDQKSEGVWNVETRTRAVYEDTKPARREWTSRATQVEVSGHDAPSAVWSATGTTDSSSDFALMYRGLDERQQHAQGIHVHPSSAADLGHYPHSVMPDPVQQRSYPQATTSAIRLSQRPMGQHQRSTSKAHTPTKVTRSLERMPPEYVITPPPSIDRAQKMHEGMAHPYTPSSHAAVYDSTPGTLDARHHPIDGRSGTAQYAGLYREMHGEEVVGFNGQVDVGSMEMQQVMPGWMTYLPGMNMYGGIEG